MPARSFPAALDGLVEQQLASCRAAWPGIDVPRDEVVELWASRVDDASSAALAALPVADLYIAAACARGDAAALRAFEARYFPGIAPALARVSTDPRFIDEVKQIVREKLFVAAGDARPKIAELAGQGDLGGLVRVIALRTALNLKRDQGRITPVEDDTMLDVLVSRADPQLHVLRQQQKDLVRRAFELAIGELEPRDRNILRMYVLHDLGIDEIGRAHGVHRATAARWLERIREDLRKATIRILRDQLGIKREEIDSVIGAAESSLHISFQRLLAG